jgi:hypothetical protein
LLQMATSSWKSLSIQGILQKYIGLAKALIS